MKPKEGAVLGAFGDTIKVLFKRKYIIILFSIVTLLFCGIDYYFPVLNFFLSMSSFSGGHVFESIVYVLQLLIKLLLKPKGLLVFFGVLVASSLAISLIFSGYFNLVNNALEGSKKFKGEFAAGIKKYFAKMWLMTFISIFISVLFVIFVLVAAVPAMVVTKAAFSGKTGLFITAMVVDFITVFVLIFSVMFFGIYMSFWYPAVFIYGKKAFTMGKRTADTYFWGLVTRFILMGLIFAIFQVIFLYMGSSILQFVLKWIFSTFFFGFFITYIFALFKRLSKRKLKAVEEDEEEE